jgi:hypothetical protein
MSAVITDRIKKQLLVDLYKDFQDSANYYFAGIGRSQDWNDSDVAPTPYNTVREQRNLRLDLQSVKNITDISFCIPRENWISGAIYSSYNDNQTGYPTNSYYVMNNNQQVYICLQQGKTSANPPQTIASTVQPTGNTTGTPFRTADGYMWKFLYSIGALKASKFISSAYMPVAKMQDSSGATLFLDQIGVDSDSPAEDVEQQLVQQNAIGGQVLGYTVVSGGSGYTSTPTATVVGNGTRAKATVTVAGGAVVKVSVKDSSDASIAFGSGYTYANVTLSGGGGSGASIRPIIGPELGLGYDARDDLKSSAIMFNTKPSGDETGSFVIEQDFRQIGLFKNLQYTDSDGVFTEEVGKTLDKLTLTAVNDGPFVNDLVIQGGTSGAKAFIDDVESDGIRYHQNEYTGFATFDSGETISIVEGGGSTTATISKILKGVVDRHTGELLYIDNRAAVYRSADQTEDIKIVIQL